MSLNIGDTISDKYRIVRLLGEGGMGAVYEGENVRIHRRVAIKILHSSVASSEDAVGRFEREAQAAGRIGSEHIVEVLDMGDLPSGDRYMVMEFLEGESLADRIKNVGRISPQATAGIIGDMLQGLSAAHAAGIVHRDLKPDNVFLLTNKGGKHDFVKIVDFGISKFSSLGGEFSMTRTGAVMGTPYYLSPEQAKGDRDLDHRADLYAVGVMLYECVAGRVPFDGESFNELLFKIVLEPVPPLSTHVPDVDAHFATIVEKGMARNASDRFQTADEMRDALWGWQEGQPPAPEFLARPPDPRQRLGSHTEVSAATHRTTNGAWANTHSKPDSAATTKKWMLAGAAAVLLLSSSAFVWMNSVKEAEAEATAQALERTRADEESKREQELARIEAEKARAEVARAKADQARSEAEKAAAETDLAAATHTLAAEKKRAEELKQAQALAQRRPAPVNKPKPAPTPTPKTGGRTIRTDL